MIFSIVDGTGFRHLMKETVPFYKVPTRNTVKSMILQKFDVLSSDFRAVLSNAEHIAITADVWSNMVTTTSYLGATGHFVDGLTIQSPVPGAYELNLSHTGDYIGENIVSFFKE